MWDKYFLDMSRLVASKSKDPSTKCGCVLVIGKAVISTGYNGLCRGMEYTGKENERPYKYMVYEHSERNAIYLAARLGTATDGATAYVTGPPCSDCTRALIQAGILEVVIPVKHNFINRMEQWKESIEVSQSLMKQCGITYREVDIDDASTRNV